MKTLTKISAMTLLAFFLAACDKPVNNAETKADVAKVEQKTAEQQGAEDFQRIADWNTKQEAVLTAAQEELQKTLEQDQGKTQEALTTFHAKVAETLQSIDNVEVKNPEVAAFKAKYKHVLALSTELIAESMQAMANPTTELQQSIQTKVQSLQEQSLELQELEANLKQKFVK